MTTARGYHSDTLRTPANLLDACLAWDRAEGGTIHIYLPRLVLGRRYRIGDGSERYVLLDGIAIGSTRESALAPGMVARWKAVPVSRVDWID